MSKRKLFFGFILIFLGLLLLGRSLELYFMTVGDLFRYLIPLGLIGLGIYLIIRKKKQEEMYSRIEINVDQSGKAEFTSAQAENFSSTNSENFAEQQSRHSSTGAGFASDRPSETPTSQNSSKIKYSKGLGDMHINCDGVSLENMDISLGLGDLELFLKGGILSPGLNRVIISGFIGDIRIYIPKEFEYCCQCSNFIGDVDMADQRASGFSNNIENHTSNYNSAPSKLYIATNSFIGDIRVFTV